MLRKFWKKYLGLILGILEKEKKSSLWRIYKISFNPNGSKDVLLGNLHFYLYRSNNVPSLDDGLDLRHLIA